MYDTGNIRINTTVRADSTLQKFIVPFLPFFPLSRLFFFISFNILFRKHMRKNKMVTKEEFESFEDYFSSSEPMKGMLWPSESTNVKSREFQGKSFKRYKQ